MTYLGFPRLHFAGVFQADTSSVNNDPEHFDVGRFYPRYQFPMVPSAPPGSEQQYGWWNPTGTGAWRVRNCLVTAVAYADGTISTLPTSDPLIGGVLRDASERVSAKLVDLDPEQQMVSEVWGLRLTLSDRAGNHVLAGEFEVAPFSDIWARYPQGQPDSFFGAMYHSVLTSVDWGDRTESRLGEQLRAATDGEMLSIKFNVDGFDDNVTSPTFTWGRLVGTIGPYADSEPHHFVAARFLQPASGSPLNQAPARIDVPTSSLLLDLGNSLPTVAAGGALSTAAGQLQITLSSPDGDRIVLGWFDSGSTDFYTQQAGVVQIQLTPEQLRAAAESQMAVTDLAGTTTYLAENAEAIYVRADDFVFRLSPGDVGRTTLYATRHGQAASDVEITAWFDPTQLISQVKQGPISGPKVGMPTTALAFPATVTTDAQGRADVTLTASDPGNPRRYIDGQVYCVAYGWGGDPSVAANNQLSVLVWSAYETPAPPDSTTWVDDVQPILQQYANLYPVMSNLLDLSDYHDVARNAVGLQIVLGLPTSDPNSMPVTRDLSPAKRSMLIDWLGGKPEPTLMQVTNIDRLRRALQLAIELEHATIPVYLTAFMTLARGRNREVSDLILSVVLEEMLHMSLACNLLNALGAEPAIDVPGFVPRYPAHLPAGLRPDLIVPLRRCSKGQIRDVFMSIEQPGETFTRDGGEIPPLPDTTGVTLDDAGLIRTEDPELPNRVEEWFERVDHHPLTIGHFYHEIARAITHMPESIFTGDSNRQLTPKQWDGAPGRLFAVVDRKSALYAITEIVVQGEGTPVRDPQDSPFSEGGQQLAHYFRFKEIVEGRRMVKTDDGSWQFVGPPIPFDESAVMPMIDNPDPISLPTPSRAAAASQLFDETYRGLLRVLHKTFNGEPQALDQAAGIMYSLEVLGRKLVSTPIDASSPTTAGPSFQAL